MAVRKKKSSRTATPTSKRVVKKRSKKRLPTASVQKPAKKKSSKVVTPSAKPKVSARPKPAPKKPASKKPAPKKPAPKKPAPKKPAPKKPAPKKPAPRKPKPLSKKAQAEREAKRLLLAEAEKATKRLKKRIRKEERLAERLAAEEAEIVAETERRRLAEIERVAAQVAAAQSTQGEAPGAPAIPAGFVPVGIHQPKPYIPGAAEIAKRATKIDALHVQGAELEDVYTLSDNEENLAAMAAAYYERLDGEKWIMPANEGRPYEGNWRWDSEYRTGHLVAFCPIVILTAEEIDRIVGRVRNATVTLDKKFPGAANYYTSIRIYEYGKERLGSGTGELYIDGEYRFVDSFLSTQKTTDPTEMLFMVARELEKVLMPEKSAVIIDTVTVRKFRMKSLDETTEWRKRQGKEARQRRLKTKVKTPKKSVTVKNRSSAKAKKLQKSSLIKAK